MTNLCSYVGWRGAISTGAADFFDIFFASDVENKKPAPTTG